MKNILAFWSDLNIMLRNKETRYCSPQASQLHLRYVAFLLFAGVCVYLRSWDATLALTVTGFLVAGYLAYSLWSLVVTLSLRGRLLPKIIAGNRQAKCLDTLLFCGYGIKEAHQFHRWYRRSLAEHYPRNL